MLKRKTRLRKKSERQRLINKIDKLFLEILKIERGKKCEICGKSNVSLGVFHILPKGLYPRLRYCKINSLLACWFPCHYEFHHNYYKARDKIIPRIKEIRGEDYEMILKVMHDTAPTLNTLYLYSLYDDFKAYLRRISR